MMRRESRLIRLVLAGAALVTVVAATPSRANRCGDQNPPRCGGDDQTDPPTLPGGTGGCTDSSLATLPMFKGTGVCRPGYMPVIYDLALPFPDNGLPADSAVVGST